MFEALGDVVVQAAPRNAAVGVGLEKEAAVQRVEETRESRPVERAEAGESAKPETSADQGRTRNRLEDGKIIVETYDGHGKLLKRTPPGFLPFGETA